METNATSGEIIGWNEVSEGLNSVETQSFLCRFNNRTKVSEGLNSVETCRRTCHTSAKRCVSEELNSVETT